MSTNKKNKKQVEDDLNSSKKMKLDFNPWEEVNTPPPTPSCSTKYDFDIWNNSNNDECEAMEIANAKCDICLKKSIKFRVSFKSTKNQCKNGEMFSFNGMDESGEVKITAFPKETQRFFDVIKFNHTYELINFNVKPESKDFPIGFGNGIYLCLLSNSIINKIDEKSVPELKFKFIEIGMLMEMEVETKCDVIGIVCKDWGREVTSNGHVKRDLNITDTSKKCVVVTLWGDNYTESSYQSKSLLIHNGVMKEFMGKKHINCLKNSLILFDPDIDESKKMKSWFEKEMKLINSKK